MSERVRRLDAGEFPAEQISAWVTVSNARADDAAGGGAVIEPDQWFVAYTNPKREDAAINALDRRAFATYLPVMTVSRGTGRRRAVVRSPLMPRYLFVGLGAGQHLAGLRGAPGLECLVRVAGRPVTVGMQIIEGLREAQAAGLYDFTDATHAEREAIRRTEEAKLFVPGTKVRIVAGPFASFGGVVEGLLQGNRISILFKMFGIQSSVPMNLTDIEKV